MKTLPILIFSVFAVLTSVAQIESKLQPFQPSSEGENSQTKSEMRFADPNKSYKTSHKLKSAITEMQRLDSTVIQSYNQNTGLWINSYKYVAEYDSAGNQTTNLALKWSSTTSTWENWSKTDFQYNPDGKLLSEIRLGWDKISNTWINKSKYEYAYDSEGNLILNAHYDWVGSPAFWRGSSKSEFAFDTFGNEILNISFGWNSYDNVWEGKEKYEKVYDAARNKTREAFFKWRYSDFGEQGFTFGWANEYVDTVAFNDNNLLQKYVRGHWSPDSTTFYYQTKKDYEYDANDSLTQITTFNIDNTDNSWITESREEYIYESGKTTYTYYLTDYVSDTLRKTNLRETLYNSNGFISSETKYYRSASSDSLVGDTKYEYSYHADGIHVFESQYYKFDVAQNKWIPQEKMKYPTYDSFGNKTEIIKSTWDVSTENWKFFSKLINNYNSNNIATLLSSYSWNESINDWVGYSKYEYNYDDNDNLINSSNYSWDAVRNDWKGKSKRENLYDNAFTIDDLILPVWISTVNMYNKPLQFLDYTWNTNSNNWVEFQLQTMYYSDVVISKVSDPVLSSVQVYPNPAADRIYINNLDGFDFVTIYNANGKTVFERRVDTMLNEIDTECFVSGLYFVRLTGTDKSKVVKILKQ